jgi:hypothetical protein
MLPVSQSAQSQPKNRRPSLLRRLLMLLVLIAAFFGANALYAAADDWHGILTGKSGELLYASSFDGFLDEWQQAPGRNSHLIENGKMRVSVQSQNVIYSAAAPYFADFDASVTVTAVEGAEDNEGAGMIFRLQESKCDLPLRLMCDLEAIDVLSVALRATYGAQDTSPRGFYVFLISTDGYYSLWQRDPVGTGLTNVTVWHKGEGLINTGLNAQNRIRIVARGDAFQFYINGQQVELCVPFPGEKPTGSAAQCQGEKTFVWHSAAFGSGKLGVVVNTYAKPGTVAEFDDFIVTSPDDGSATANTEA